MKINSPTEDRIIVELSRKDMQDFDITYEKMDYSSLETRRVIRCVLDAAGRALGRDVDFSRRMMIEAIPEADGGCILSFTLLSKKYPFRPMGSVLKKQSGIMLFGFSSAENLLNCICSFPKINADYESLLYENNGSYRLVIKSAEDLYSVRCHIEEYCNEFSLEKSDYDFTAEHWKTVIDNSAIAKIISACNFHLQGDAES